MDIAILQTAITTVGFPIVCVGVLCWFIWQLWRKTQEQNEKREEKTQEQSEKREEKLYVVLGEVNATNKELSATNHMLVEQFKNDIAKVKEDLQDIKDVILK